MFESEVREVALSSSPERIMKCLTMFCLSVLSFYVPFKGTHVRVKKLENTTKRNSKITSNYLNGYPEKYVDEVFELLSDQNPEILEFFKSRYSETEQYDLIISFLKDDFDDQQETEQEVIDTSVWSGFSDLKWSLEDEMIGLVGSF